eukprot:PhF_6_TR36148/c0_g2_i1/m.52539
MYKSKALLTTFLLKLLIKRLVSRSISKVMLPFAAAPLMMVWNGTVSWFIMRESRLIVAGPNAVLALSDAVVDSVPFVLPFFVRRDIITAIGLLVRQAKRVHPTVEILLLHLKDRFGMEPVELAEQNVDLQAMSRQLASPLYTLELKRVVILHVILAVMVTGRVRIYRPTLVALLTACEFRTGLKRIRRLCETFSKSVSITPLQLMQCLEDGGESPHPNDEDNALIKCRRAFVWLMSA